MSTIVETSSDVPPGPYELPSKRVESKRPLTSSAAETSQTSRPEENLNDDTTKENNLFEVAIEAPLRKQLACQRIEDDMITSSDDDDDNSIEVEDDVFDDVDDDEEDEEASNIFHRKLFFTSPRLLEPDENLFPVQSSYQRLEERWQHISDQAGSHRQDGTVLIIGRKITPLALKVGMTQQAAKRVRSLNLWLDHDKDILPEWLDVIAAVFQQLEHLTLTEDIFPGEDEMAVSARMRRLYVLYRLPYLKSIDDMVVTEQERKMALPNGDIDVGRVPVRFSTTWTSLLDRDDSPFIPINREENDDASWKRTHPQLYQHLAHEMPVEIIHDKFSHGVLNDGVYADEKDGLGQIPRIPATASNVSTRTAKEVGVEINQELAAKFAELNRNTTATTASETSGFDFDDSFDNEDDDDELAGEAMLSDLAASSEEQGFPDNNVTEQLTEPSVYGDDSYAHGDVVVGLASAESQETECSNHVDAVEVNLSGIASRHMRDDFLRKHSVPPLHNNPRCTGDRLAGVRNHLSYLTDDSLRCTIEKHTSVRSQVLDSSDNSIELVSVASTDLEWTAACGVLAFRSDRSCAPRLRMPFSRNRKVLDADAAVAAIRRAKANLRSKQFGKCSDVTRNDCTPVARNDAINSPEVGCFAFGSSQSKFFPDGRPAIALPSDSSHSSVSANKQVPPSKSLSSPFPMQFRERQKTPPKTNLMVQTTESTDSSRSGTSTEDTRDTIGSPIHAINTVSSNSPNNGEVKKLRAAGKGDLPPPCPAGSRRKVPVPRSQMSKTRRRKRRLKATKESARSTSVMDLEDDEEVDEYDISQTSEWREGIEDRDSFEYSEAS